jgi:hypothetical protein
MAVNTAIIPSKPYSEGDSRRARIIPIMKPIPIVPKPDQGMTTSRLSQLYSLMILLAL